MTDTVRRPIPAAQQLIDWRAYAQQLRRERESCLDDRRLRLRQVALFERSFDRLVQPAIDAAIARDGRLTPAESRVRLRTLFEHKGWTS